MRNAFDRCRLISKDPDDYPGDPHGDHVLEQYKLYTQQADADASRAQTANRFFLTLNLAILSAGVLACRDGLS